MYVEQCYTKRIGRDVRCLTSFLGVVLIVIMIIYAEPTVYSSQLERSVNPISLYRGLGLVCIHGFSPLAEFDEGRYCS